MVMSRFKVVCSHRTVISAVLSALVLLPVLACLVFVLVPAPDPQVLVVTEAPFPEDDGAINPHFVLARHRMLPPISFCINPSNNLSIPEQSVVSGILNAEATVDSATSRRLFIFSGITPCHAGVRDWQNTVSFEPMGADGRVAITYLWVNWLGVLLETDTILNSAYPWSANGKNSTFDLQNVMTHEFGHWAGLEDLKDGSDRWLTMYYLTRRGETDKRSLGLGDLQGIASIYGP
jgi:hypothetical protein